MAVGQGQHALAVDERAGRVFVTNAVAALPTPAPMAALLPDPTDTDLLPGDEPWFQALLLLVYTPTYDPDANRIAWLWRALRAAVTHNHQRQTLEELLNDATVWADALTPAAVLDIGSPIADEPTSPEELKHAA